jgi:hypothetical protein
MVKQVYPTRDGIRTILKKYNSRYGLMWLFIFKPRKLLQSGLYIVKRIGKNRAYIEVESQLWDEIQCVLCQENE